MQLLIQRSQVQDLEFLTNQSPQGRHCISPLIIKHRLGDAIIIILREDACLHRRLSDLPGWPICSFLVLRRVLPVTESDVEVLDLFNLRCLFGGAIVTTLTDLIAMINTIWHQFLFLVLQSDQWKVLARYFRHLNTMSEWILSVSGVSKPFPLSQLIIVVDQSALPIQRHESLLDGKAIEELLLLILVKLLLILDLFLHVDVT